MSLNYEEGEGAPAAADARAGVRTTPDPAPALSLCSACSVGKLVVGGWV